MADLPPIENPTPIVVPSVDAKTFSEWYITDLFLRADHTDLTKTVLSVILYPYNYAKKELLDAVESRQEFVIADMWAEAQRAPLLATVIGQLVAAVNLLQKEKYLTEQIAAVAEGADITALQTQLTEVQTDLGIS